MSRSVPAKPFFIRHTLPAPGFAVSLVMLEHSSYLSSWLYSVRKFRQNTYLSATRICRDTRHICRDTVPRTSTQQRQDEQGISICRTGTNNTEYWYVDYSLCQPTLRFVTELETMPHKNRSCRKPVFSLRTPVLRSRYSNRADGGGVVRLNAIR